MTAAEQAANPGLWRGFVNFLGSILEGINTITGNYGLAVVLFTILMRFALLPFDIKSRKANQKMSKLQPMIKEINEKYKNDPEKKNKKTMDLYKTHGASPFGGCLPMLIQMPLFFALFAALRSISDAAVLSNMVDPFLWIKNIWQPDSPLVNFTGEKLDVFTNFALIGRSNGYFILPVLAGITSYYQMRYANPSGGAANEQMKGFSKIFPLMSVWFCAMYTAAFAIYWVTANIFQIVQNLLLVKMTPPEKEGVQP